MKTRAVILAGGAGSRLGILTSKRAKPAVPFGGKYRIIDFTLSNCVNSGIFDVMILAQYRPHSLIDHIGSGGPWDLARDFTGGVRIYTPYKGRGASDWYMGTADAVQQNFRFIKGSTPDLVLILSGDHIYEMNYDVLVTFHRDHEADLTMATITVPLSEASRFGTVEVGEDYRVTRFMEKPDHPTSNLVNMGVYLFTMSFLDEILWEDHLLSASSHDFGKDILPRMINEGAKVHAYPYSGYWMDVGTVESYWKAHMDLLAEKPSIKLNDRSWIVHTRTEERPPARIANGAGVMDSMITDGCEIAPYARVERSILSPGVKVEAGAVIHESVILTDCYIETGAIIERAVIDKKVRIGNNSRVGGILTSGEPVITTVGKNSQIPPLSEIMPGAIIDTDVIASDFPSKTIRSDDYIKTRRQPHEV
ncbi:MAG: NTP transferase domain-containing protein [Anaerolineales bacterium]|nr:NTP transferase domain-containing protein [Anaerolineales bacterium]